MDTWEGPVLGGRLPYHRELAPVRQLPAISSASRRLGSSAQPCATCPSGRLGSTSCWPPLGRPGA